MNPCSDRQKDIALLAAGALDANESRSLRQHLAHCSACHQYEEELSLLCREHASVPDRWPALASPETFHRRLVDRIKAPETTAPLTLPQPVFTRWLGLRQRLALAGLAIGLVVIAALQFRLEDVKPNPIPATAKPDVARAKEASPSFLSYRLAANQSSAALDALLARNAANSPDPGRPVTAAMRALDDLTD